MPEALIPPSEEEEAQRAREAEHLLQHPMVVGALDAMEAHFDQEWRTTTLTQTDERETAYRMLLACQTFRKLLTKHIETGTLLEVAKAEEQERERLRNASA